MAKRLVTHNTSALIAKVTEMARAITAGSVDIRNAMIKIGMYVEALTKTNVRRQGLIDTGRLINSIRYELMHRGSVEGVNIGSFNVPYAAAHEFGVDKIETVRAHQRTISEAFGYAIDPRVIQIREHTRSMFIEARPYLRPAIKQATPFIVDTLRAIIRK